MAITEYKWLKNSRRLQYMYSWCLLSKGAFYGRWRYYLVIMILTVQYFGENILIWVPIVLHGNVTQVKNKGLCRMLTLERWCFIYTHCSNIYFMMFTHCSNIYYVMMFTKVQWYSDTEYIISIINNTCRYR